MVRNIHFHISLPPSMLDRYLSEGWYRIGPFVFTTDHVPYNEGSDRVFWLRYRLDQYKLEKKQNKLLKGIRDLDIYIRPLKITEELEELYARYRQQVEFNASENLYKLLYDELAPELIPQELFSSQVVEIRDKNKLIAAGILDLGKNSTAGIVNFYDPAYKKLSLGKCLMLLKLGYSQSVGMQFYYPGYIAVNYSKFDYKLFAGEAFAEIYDPAMRRWLPYSRDLMQELKENFPVGESGSTKDEQPLDEKHFSGQW